MITLPIDGSRFRLRRLVATDAPALAAYRSDPTTAGLQSWTVPYPLDAAERMIAAQAELAGPTNDEWFAIGIADAETDELLGDVATHVEWDGKCVEIGYTLAPDARGRGLATEAVGAVIDALIAAGARRLRAETHPDNLASMLVLERLGFDHEGVDVGAYWVGEPPNEEVSDNVRFGMTAERRAAWLTRPLDPPLDVRLVELTNDSAREYLRLRTHHTQQRFVAEMPKSFADALVPPLDDDGEPLVPWLRGVEADGVPAGFVMVADPTATCPDPGLWRLLIDRWHQRRGIGERVVAEVASHYRSQGHRRLLTSYVPGRGSPEPFYARLGFVPTGELEDDEIVAALDL